MNSLVIHLPKLQGGLSYLISMRGWSCVYKSALTAFNHDCSLPFLALNNSNQTDLNDGHLNIHQREKNYLKQIVILKIYFWGALITGVIQLYVQSMQKNTVWLVKRQRVSHSLTHCVNVLRYHCSCQSSKNHKCQPASGAKNKNPQSCTIWTPWISAQN